MPPAIQFGTEPFTAATGNRAEGIPDHAIMIEGRLIHLDTKNLKEWGITADATKQIMTGIPGVPIRACNSRDPHACDLVYDDDSRVGYATQAWVDGEWVMAAAAITDKNAAKNIDDGTWTPFGKGGWSVVGFPDGSRDNFKQTGFMTGFRPSGISLVLAPSATPAFEGSGFEMVTAAIFDYRGNNMPDKDKDDGNDPATYTQEQLDAMIEKALEKQKTDDADATKKAADAELAKQKDSATEALAKQQAAHDAEIKKLSADDKAIYDAKIAEMTSKEDMKTILDAHGKQVQEATLDAIERGKLTTEYEDVVRNNPVVGAPFVADGAFDQGLFDAEMQTFDGMQTAAIAGIVSKAKMVAAAVPGQSAFDATRMSGTPPGSEPEGVDQKALDAMGIPSIEFV